MISPHDPLQMQKRIIRLALVLVALLIGLVGCRPQPDPVVQKLVDAVNAKELVRAGELFASDAVVDIGSPISISDQQEVSQLLESLFADNLKLEMQDARVQGGKVMVGCTVQTESIHDLCLDSLNGTAEITVLESKITELRFALDDESRAKLSEARLSKNIACSPMLTYAVIADPSPIHTAGDLQGDSDASFTVLITNRTHQTVNVTEIVLQLPEGARAADLTGDPTIIHSTAPMDTTDRQVGKWGSTLEGGGRIRISPKISGEGKINPRDGLSFTISKIAVNKAPGSLDLKIIETILDGKGGSVKRSTTVQLDKLPPTGFSVGDLVANPSIIKAGGNTTLAWSGSKDAIYAIIFSNGTGEVSQKFDKPPYQYSVKNLQETTTFYLARIIGEKATVLRERTVTVIQPTPTPVPTVTSNEGDPDYIDDRSTPITLINSYYNAINLKQYARAYSYWLDPEIRYIPFTSFVEEYRSTQSIEWSIGEIGIHRRMGERYFVQVPFTQDTSDMGTRSYVACFFTANEMENPTNDKLYSVGIVDLGESSADPPTLPENICSRVGMGFDEQVDMQEMIEIIPRDKPNNRSRPKELLNSFFSAINRKDYTLAHSYWEGVGNLHQPVPLEQFQQSYASFQSVQMTLGDVRSREENGNIYYFVPAYLEVQTTSGGMQTFAGCYTLHYLDPDLQKEPPFHPLAIQSDTLQQVASDINPDNLLKQVCGEEQ
jgi:hypothetical protein